MWKYNETTGMFEEIEDSANDAKIKSSLLENSNKTDSFNKKTKFEFRDFLAYVVAFIAYVVAGFILALIFDWMDGCDKSADFNVIFASCFGVFMLWITRKEI